MELTPEQVIIVGLVASGLAAVVRLIVAKWGNKVITKDWMTVIVSAVALILAVVFNIPNLPVYTDPLQYLGEWTVLLASYLGAATAIYNIILDKVLDVFPSLQVEKLVVE
ncbi:MAG: hypothetical protein ACXABN_18745 [Candidatus Thorarchaeota archaeon]|jgi:nitrate/nitrite transporter NarK